MTATTGNHCDHCVMVARYGAMQGQQTIMPSARLSDLLAAYAALKSQVDELTDQLDAIKDGIKRELTTAAPGATQIRVDHPALAQGLQLTYVESWRVDAKTLKAADPETYVRYAVKGGRWELRAVKG